MSVDAAPMRGTAARACAPRRSADVAAADRDRRSGGSAPASAASGASRRRARVSRVRAAAEARAVLVVRRRRSPDRAAVRAPRPSRRRTPLRPRSMPSRVAVRERHDVEAARSARRRQPPPSSVGRRDAQGAAVDADRRIRRAGAAEPRGAHRVAFRVVATGRGNPARRRDRPSRSEDRAPGATPAGGAGLGATRRLDAPLGGEAPCESSALAACQRISRRRRAVGATATARHGRRRLCRARRAATASSTRRLISATRRRARSATPPPSYSPGPGRAGDAAQRLGGAAASRAERRSASDGGAPSRLTSRARACSARSKHWPAVPASSRLSRRARCARRVPNEHRAEIGGSRCRRRGGCRRSRATCRRRLARLLHGRVRRSGRSRRRSMPGSPSARGVALAARHKSCGRRGAESSPLGAGGARERAARAPRAPRPPRAPRRRPRPRSACQGARTEHAVFRLDRRRFARSSA